jgi:very-short-patch-repair endonuclease
MIEERSEAVDRIAGAQHGLLTHDQAVSALGRGRKSRWLTERRLTVVQPAVYRVAGAPQTWHQAVAAAQLATAGVVSHRSAAELWGLIQPAGYIEVSVSPPRHPRVHLPAVAHRVIDLHPELSVERSGLHVTDPVRTVIDLGLVLPKWAVGDALSRGITTKLFRVTDVDRLRDALGRQGRNGTGVMRQVLEERLLLGGTEESLLEKRFNDLVRRHDVPAAATQYELWHAGRFIARIDAAYPERKLAIEVDGFAAHTSPDTFQRDRTRQNRLVALGWTVLRFTWADIVQRPAMVAAQIREAIGRLPAA